MATAAQLLAGRHNFYSFAEVDKEKKVSTVVQVEHAEIFIDGDLICFRIGASHFLWKMVRRIVGMLVEVGRGNCSVEPFCGLIKERSGVPAEFTAPPAGLFLEKVLFRGDEPPNEMRAVMPLPHRSSNDDNVKKTARRRK
jgi:tRNA pseudouridine38-40 synthase